MKENQFDPNENNWILIGLTICGDFIMPILFPIRLNFIRNCAWKMQISSLPFLFHSIAKCDSFPVRHDNKLHKRAALRHHISLKRIFREIFFSRLYCVRHRRTHTQTLFRAHFPLYIIPEKIPRVLSFIVLFELGEIFYHFLKLHKMKFKWREERRYALTQSKLVPMIKWK